VSPEQRRYLFVQTAIGAAVVNAVLNGAIGWGMTRGFVEFPVWKAPGVVPDLVATAFGVAFGTCLGSVLQVRLDMGRGKITVPAVLPASLSAVTSRLPSRLLPRAVFAGVVSIAAFAPPVILALGASGSPALARSSVIVLKAGFSAVEGAIVAPLLVLAALLDRADARPPS
jgi:hypothetical protein